MSTGSGLLEPAIRWSWAGLGFGIAGWIALLAFSVGDGDDLPMSNHLHRLVTTSFAILILGALAVQLSARIIRGQRRLRAALSTPPRCGYAEGYADGLARRPVATGRGHLTVVDISPDRA